MKSKCGMRLMASAICAVCVVALAGCYERVVRAEGLGAQGVAVQKPYRSEGPLDKAVFPDKPSDDSGFGTSSSSIRPPPTPR
ncbi:MAG: hypothetical protein ACREJD_03315 [Phycisphaerales bacterium]